MYSRQKNKQKKRDRNTVDINIMQTMVGKQWVKSRGMYRGAGEAKHTGEGNEQQ